MNNSKKALKIHALIKKLINKLDDLGYEFMFFPGGTSIRSKRHEKSS
tara:strand:+ start:10 stop:150 length:141 start_codon:yes stop_codon:yes gene_type:complete